MYLFILLLTAHFITDYLIQNDRLVKGKRDGKLSALFIHVLHYFVLACLLTLPWISIRWMSAIIIQTVVHFILDYYKNQLIRKVPHESFFPDLIDLLAHILVIWLTMNGLNPQMSPIMPGCILNIYTHLSFYIICILGISTIFITRTATYLIRSLLEGLTPKKSEQFVSKKEYRTGQVIGNLERILIFIFVFTGHLGAIAVIIAAKSIARYKELENKAFAEYYLVGTLLSTIIAIIAAYTTRWGIAAL